MKVIALDFAYTENTRRKELKRPVVFDGERIIRLESLDNLRKLDFDVLLVEEGIPKTLLVRCLNGKSPRVMFVDGREVAKYRRRHNLKKSDLIDCLVIWKLYQLQPGKFKELTDNDVKILKVRYYLKKYLTIQRNRIRVQNSAKMFEKHYGNTLGIDDVLRKLEEAEVRASEDLIFVVSKEFPCEFNILRKIKGIGELTAAKLIASVGGFSRFRSVDKLKKFCGVAPGRYQDYDRTAKETLYIIAVTFIVNKIEPFYSKYVEYKNRQPNSLPKFAIERKAKKFLMSKILEYMYRAYILKKRSS